MNFLKQMMQTVSPSGSEENINSVIKKEIENFFDEVYVDNLGSLILHKKNRGKRVMLVSSVDRPGILVTHVNRFGTVFFEKIGRINDDALAGSVVTFSNGAFGIICEDKNLSSSFTEKKRKFFVDIMNGNVSVGEVAVLKDNFLSCDNFIYGRCLGYLAGAFALVESIKRFNGYSDNDLYFVFSSFGVLHNRGVKAASFNINPDFAVCVNGCKASDGIKSNMNISESFAECGNGMAIKFKDKSVITNKLVRDRFVSIAAENGIPYQFSFTDEDMSMPGVLELSGKGVLCGEVCVPVKHGDLCSDTISVSDLNNCIEFLLLFVKSKF